MSEKATWCERHWKPYLSTSGGLVASVKLMQTVVSMYSDEVGKDASPAEMNALVERHAPLCCTAGDEYMEALYEWTLNNDRHCLTAYIPGQPHTRCHRFKGHEGECTHFWPPIPKKPGVA